MKVKKLFFLLAAMLLTSVCAMAQNNVTTPQKGDVNGDGIVDVADIVAIIDEMAKPQADSIDNPDVHEAVDLGLPSGTLWAACNIGASKPEDYGLYFAWGETKGYGYYESHDFNWSSYKWCNGDERSLTKYCTASYYGKVDSLTTLELSDDAARANWGGLWRMPTWSEFQELIENTDNWWTQVNGVGGRRFTSKTNGKSIFIPAVGERWDGGIRSERAYGYCWSSTFDKSGPHIAYGMYIGNTEEGHIYFANRPSGLSVRPVRRN